jgi:hypothetical protein
MNERIKELLAKSLDNEAIIASKTFGHWALYDEDLEKFAELIVRECMRMCDVAAIGYESHNHFKEANGCYSAKEYIEEHFGVEE